MREAREVARDVIVWGKQDQYEEALKLVSRIIEADRAKLVEEIVGWIRTRPRWVANCELADLVRAEFIPNRESETKP